MTHSINFKATDELLALFTAQQAEGVESPLASIKVAIADETFVLAGTTPSAGDGATDFAQMKATLEADCACYVLFRRRVATEPWALLSFVPDTAPIKEKMLLSSSKEALKKALGGVFGLEVQFSALEDVALEGEKSDAEKAAEQLAMMTTFEREAAEVKRGEAGAAADGKVKSSNLAFPLSADASAQLDAFAAGTVAMVALSIEGETIALRRAEADLPLASLAAALPTDEPSYCVFRWAHERDGAAVAPVLFVYMCPEDAPVRGKMLHASSKASMVQPASHRPNSPEPPPRLPPHTTLSAHHPPAAGRRPRVARHRRREVARGDRGERPRRGRRHRRGVSGRSGGAHGRAEEGGAARRPQARQEVGVRREAAPRTLVQRL